MYTTKNGAAHNYLSMMCLPTDYEDAAKLCTYQSTPCTDVYMTILIARQLL